MSWLETYVENWATFKILDVDTPPQTVFDVRFKAKPRAVLSGLSKMDFMITLFVSNPSSRNNFLVKYAIVEWTCWPKSKFF